MELGLGLANNPGHHSPGQISGPWAGGPLPRCHWIFSWRVASLGERLNLKVNTVLVMRPFSKQEAQCHCTVSHKASFSQRLLCLMREPRDCSVQLSSVTNHWKSSFHSGEYTTQYSVCPLQMLTVPRHRRQEANSQIWKFEFTTYGSDCLRLRRGKIVVKSH